MNLSESDARQSTLFKAMRFPLIVMVLYVHSSGVSIHHTLTWDLEGWNIFHAFSSLISQDLCSIATCWFFFFSGYLFYWNLKDGEFGKDWIFQKWKKRIHSILIPYLLWNTLMVLCVFLKNKLYNLISLGSNPVELESIEQGPLFWYITGPVDFPLWFLLDLIILTIIAPALYPIFKKCGYLALVPFAVLYLSPWGPSIPSVRGIFYFSIGACLGIHKESILEISKKSRIWTSIAALLLLFLTLIHSGQPSYWLWLRLFIPFGMIVFMNFCDRLIENKKIAEWLCAMSSTVFFVYAIHEIYILGWIKGLFLRIFGESLTATWISYLFVPVATLFLCLSLYAFFKRMSPKLLAFTCGGRV